MELIGKLICTHDRGPPPSKDKTVQPRPLDSSQQGPRQLIGRVTRPNRDVVYVEEIHANGTSKSCVSHRPVPAHSASDHVRACASLCVETLESRHTETLAASANLQRLPLHTGCRRSPLSAPAEVLAGDPREWKQRTARLCVALCSSVAARQKHG